MSKLINGKEPTPYHDKEGRFWYWCECCCSYVSEVRNDRRK